MSARDGAGYTPGCVLQSTVAGAGPEGNDVIITVERRRAIRAPAKRIIAVLQNAASLEALMPRVERVEMLSRGDRRMRLALHMRFSRLGSLRVEGEARELDDGTRFVAVQPIEIDSRFHVAGHGDESEVVARLSFELPRQLAPFARWIPQRSIQERVARELDTTLEALEELVLNDEPPEKTQRRKDANM